MYHLVQGFWYMFLRRLQYHTSANVQLGRFLLQRIQLLEADTVKVKVSLGCGWR